MVDRNKRFDMGAVASLNIRCISETGWFDTQTMLDDIKAAGGLQVSQYELDWPPLGRLHAENAAGSSALIEVGGKDGRSHKILLDSGWGPEWMDKRFAEEGIDTMLRQGEIECLVISHEHFDHFWGIGSLLKYCPGISIYVPEGFSQAGLDFIRQQGHAGMLTVVPLEDPISPIPGLTIVNYPMDTLLQTRGENVIYCNLEGKGMVMLTGCCHAGVISLLDYAARNFVGGDQMYAVYGGLHISPFEDWDEGKDKTIEALSRYGIEKLGCNHCTGAKAVQKMIAAGLPVVRGTARNGSKTDLFLGNGDRLQL